MNKIDLLKARRTKLFTASSDIRKKISEIIDDDSFVELDTYSFSKNEFFDEDVDGLGVVTGYATINDNSVYIVAQNGKLLNGGISKAGCDKICKCLEKAGQTETPVVYFLESQGVQVGEGVSVLEGISGVLSAMSHLKGAVPQFAIVLGDVFGSVAFLASGADYTFVLKNGCVSYASPSVIAASSKDVLGKDVIGGIKAVNGVATFISKDLAEVKNSIVKILDTIPLYGGDVIDAEDDMNRVSNGLNIKSDAKSVIDATFDKNTFTEMNKDFSAEVITGIGRVGGISTAGVIFDGGEEGVELDLNNVLKIKNFLYYAAENNFPVVAFVNAKGISTSLNVAQSYIMSEIPNLIMAINQVNIVSVVYKKAIGLAYSLFVAKNMRINYSYAFADAKISLLDGKVGVAAEFGEIKADKIDALSEKYCEEVQDAFNAAKIGCIDNIIEPMYVRQYVISALQTLIK